MRWPKWVSGFIRESREMQMMQWRICWREICPMIRTLYVRIMKTDIPAVNIPAVNIPVVNIPAEIIKMHRKRMGR